MTNTTPQDTSVEYDAVNHPRHYTSHPSGVECIEITRHMGFNTGNAMKYVWRADLKHADGGIEDLEKAEFYIKDEIAKRKAEKAKKQSGSLIVDGKIDASTLNSNTVQNISIQVHPASGLSTEEAEKAIAKVAAKELNWKVLAQ
jgi:Protein of unknwon function (DUF3310)